MKCILETSEHTVAAIGAMVLPRAFERSAAAPTVVAALVVLLLRGVPCACGYPPGFVALSLAQPSILQVAMAAAGAAYPRVMCDACHVWCLWWQEIRYFTPHNFVGDPIDGYEAPECILTVEAANALGVAQDQLRRAGMCAQRASAVNIGTWRGARAPGLSKFTTATGLCARSRTLCGGHRTSRTCV